LEIGDFLDWRLEIGDFLDWRFNPKSKIQNPKSKIQNPKSKITSADDGYAETQEYPIPNPGVSFSDRASVEQEPPAQLQPAKEH
jgi:hypothetical protein